MYHKAVDSIFQFMNQYGQAKGYEAKQLYYMIDVLFGELLKFIILTVFFALFGVLQAFLYALGALLVIRTLVGGLHFKTFRSCLIFTLFFMVMILVSDHLFSVSDTGWWLGAIGSISIILIGAPVQSKLRPPLSQNKKTVVKTLAIIWILSHLISHAYFVHPYLSISYWVMIYVIVQLLIGKGVIYYEEKIIRSSSTLDM